MGHIYIVTRPRGLGQTWSWVQPCIPPPLPRRLILPDSFIACFYGNSLSTGLDRLMQQTCSYGNAEAALLRGIFMVTGMASAWFHLFIYYVIIYLCHTIVWFAAVFPPNNPLLGGNVSAVIHLASRPLSGLRSGARQSSLGLLGAEKQRW